MSSFNSNSLGSSTSIYDSPVPEYGDLGSKSNADGPETNYALAVPDGRNWNEEYQTLLDLSFESEDEEMHRLAQLRQLSHEFATRATEIGQVIITEKALSNDDKTIKHHTQQLGGYAGGEKYLVEGIFFKFAVDNRGLYGDDEHAMKCGVHEFKSFMELTDCRVQGLHFPLIVIIDYRGFRLLCQSVLPVGSNTLIYGSSDGGKHVYATDPDMNRRMKRVAKMLNLAGHNVWDMAKTTQVRLHGPVDCEGHLGVDGRFYIIDPARLFPPAKPKPSVKGGKLFMLLRPELVMKSRFPLCSDSFSNFNIEDRATHDERTEQLDTYLHSELIPEFAQFLCHEYHNKYNITNSTGSELGTATMGGNGTGTLYASIATPFTPTSASLYHVLTTQHLDLADLERIINEAHRKGINLRYFGEVRQLVPHSASRSLFSSSTQSSTSSSNKSDSDGQSKEPTFEPKSSKPHRRSTSQDEEVLQNNPAQGSLGLDLLRQVLLTIIAGRALKNLIRSHLRTIHTPDERPYRKLLLTYLNLLFGRTPKAVEFWSRPIKASIEKSFPSTLTAQELDPSFNLRSSILPYTLYLYLQDLLGLEMRVESKAKFTNGEIGSAALGSISELGPSQYLLFKALVDSDLINVFPKVRYTNRMSFEEGTALSKKAKFAGSQEASDRYFHLAEKNYRSALRIKPDDYRALHNWGLSLSLQAQTKTGPEALNLYALAQSKWSQALEINAQDYRAFVLWGNMLLERAESIPTALPHHMDGTSKNKMLAAREVEKLSLLEEACSKYASAYELNEEQYETLYNWATALLIRGTLDSAHALTLLQEAANKYQGATAIKDYSLKAHLNWAVALAKCARATFDKAFPPSAAGSSSSSNGGGSANTSLPETSSRANRRSTEIVISRMAISSSPPPSSPPSSSTWNAPQSLQASTSSKAFKKAEKSFAISTEKFEECIELRPDDCEVYFNFGNALYRRARMHERCRSYSTAMELCSLCCERYISAINIKLNYYDALYNWGSVVHFLTTIPQLESKETQILFIVNCYLEVFKKVALKYGGTERFKLDPVLSLLHSRRETIQRRAIHVINSLCNDGKDAIQREAYRAIKSLLSNPVTRRMMNEELEEDDWSKYASNIVRSIGTANKWVDDEDEGGKVTLDSFTVGTVIDGGDAGVGKMMRTVRKTTQQPFVMVIVAHNELLDRLGILEKEGALSSMNQEQAFALRKSFINHLKTERNFITQLQYSFQTEEDDYCLLYRYAYNPGMLWEFLSNPNTHPKLREQHIRFYAAEILLALQSLHAREMMYGDLNPLELVVDHLGHILLHKIPFSQHALIKPSDLSPEYVSPEVLTSQQPYRSTTDWYCFGVLLYQLATCIVQSFSSTAAEQHAQPSSSSSSSSSSSATAPTPSKPSGSGRHSRASSSDTKNGVAENNRIAYIPALSWVDDGQDVNFGTSSSISSDLKDLISKLLHMDPKLRLDLAPKIQKHPFWANMNWKLAETAGLEPPFRPGLGPASGLTNTFTAVPTLLAKLKRGKFHGYSFVEP
jgi:serine/threonine protein kinase/tetratricopeptide (TPR) repeat protein